MPWPIKLLYPILSLTGSFISLIPRWVVLPAVLKISAGNDAKFPSGDLLTPFTKSDT